MPKKAKDETVSRTLGKTKRASRKVQKDPRQPDLARILPQDHDAGQHDPPLQDNTKGKKATPSAKARRKWGLKKIKRRKLAMKFCDIVRFIGPKKVDCTRKCRVERAQHPRIGSDVWLLKVPLARSRTAWAWMVFYRFESALQSLRNLVKGLAAGRVIGVQA